MSVCLSVQNPNPLNSINSFFPPPRARKWTMSLARIRTWVFCLPDRCANHYTTSSTPREQLKCGELTQFSAHKLGHEAVEKNFKCEMCGLSYKSNAYLLGHIRRIHENSEAGRWLCKICGKEFSQSGGLANHKKSHIGKLFKCLSCDKAYNRNDLLKKHMLTHSGAYKKCNVCNKKLSIYTPLSEHMKTHTGEKPFSCKYCILRTALKENLKRHVKRVHKKEFFD